MKTIFRVLLCVVLCWSGRVWGQEAGGNQLNIGAIWPADTANASSDFLHSVQPGAGFSFSYDGKTVGPVDFAGWDIKQDGLTATLRHPSGLTVTRTARVFPECGAIEYSVVFRNDGHADLPALTDVKAIDVSFARPAGAADVATTCGGGGHDKAFPPDPKGDSTLTRTTLQAPADSISLGGERGHCSLSALPFWYIQNAAGDAGMFAGLGWAGQWRGTIKADAQSHLLHIEGGIADLDLKLKPGEQIPGPAILLGHWRGPMDAGVNRLRRLIRDRYAPPVDGKRLVPPVMYCTWHDIGAELDEKMAYQLIDRAAEMGQEIFELDAGWYNGTPSAPWSNMGSTFNAYSNSLGNWDQGADAKRFPSGLKAMAERVRARGMQFGLWFEIERAGPDSQLSKQHPDWMMAAPGRRWLLVDLGNPAAQDYFDKLFDRMIPDIGIRYIRWDVDVHDFLTYWQSKDAPGRTGITQIRYIQGLHHIEEHIIQKHPEVILENCACGGLRVDLMSLARHQALWSSDATDTRIVPYHQVGLNEFLPGNGLMIALAPRAAETHKPDFVLPDYNCQVCFAGAFGLGGRLNEWSPAIIQTVKKNVDVFKQLRQFLAEDFYPLVPQVRTEQTWAAWQFHNPNSQEGFVQALRIHSPAQKQTLPLKGLDPAKTYQFTDPYSKAQFEVAGDQLLSKGLEFDLSELSSRVLLYKAR